MMKENLEELLLNSEISSEYNLDSEPKANVLVLSNIALSTKLSDPDVLYNVGQFIKNSPYKIDAIIMLGGAYRYPLNALNSNSRSDKSSLAMLEDDIKGRYGARVHKAIKGKNSGSNSVDTLEDATLLAKYEMRPIIEAAAEKNIPISMIYGPKDYANVGDRIKQLLKSHKRSSNINKQSHENKDDDDLDTVLRDLDPEIIQHLKSQNIDASAWRNLDEDGIVDIANKIYKEEVLDTFLSYKKKDETVYSANIIKTIEDVRLKVNGVEFSVSPAINATANIDIYGGIKEPEPLLNGERRAIEKANRDWREGRLADVYIWGHEARTYYTAIKYNTDTESETPSKVAHFLHVSPLHDDSVLRKKKSSGNVTKDVKRSDLYSGITMFTVMKDGRTQTRVINYRTLKEGVNPKELEKDMIKIYGISDTHIGASSYNPEGGYTEYELLEALLEDIKHDGINKDKRYTILGGDMLQGAVDKIMRGDIQDPQKMQYGDVIRDLYKTERDISYDRMVRRVREMVYGEPIINLGDQLNKSAIFLKELTDIGFKAFYNLNGNHVEKAANNLHEAEALGAILEANGANVIYPERMMLRRETVHIGPYPAGMQHSIFIRGMDGGRALSERPTRTTSPAVIQYKGDEHRPHLSLTNKMCNGKMNALVGIGSQAFQDYTTFESNKIGKEPSPQGYISLKVPSNPEIGTGYIVFEMVPNEALENRLRHSGGSSVERLAGVQYLERKLAYAKNDEERSMYMKKLERTKDLLNRYKVLF
jgi:hypothetical protein